MLPPSSSHFSLSLFMYWVYECILHILHIRRYVPTLSEADSKLLAHYGDDQAAFEARGIHEQINRIRRETEHRLNTILNGKLEEVSPIPKLIKMYQRYVAFPNRLQCLTTATYRPLDGNTVRAEESTRILADIKDIWKASTSEDFDPDLEPLFKLIIDSSLQTGYYYATRFHKSDMHLRYVMDEVRLIIHEPLLKAIELKAVIEEEKFACR